MNKVNAVAWLENNRQKRLSFLYTIDEKPAKEKGIEYLGINVTVLVRDRCWMSES